MKIVFDTSIFIHANYHIMKKYDEGWIDSKALAYNVCEQIKSIAFKKFPISKFYAALDSDKYFRGDIYPEYKKNRSPKDFDKKEVNHLISENLNTIHHDGLEADDVCFIFSKLYKNTTIVSQDNDCRLMAIDGTELYNYKTDTYASLTPGGYLMEAIAKICDGCDSDNVPKIKLKPFGPKFLSGFVMNHLSLKEHLDLLQEVEYISDWKQNYDLVFYDPEIYEKYLEIDFDKFK